MNLLFCPRKQNRNSSDADISADKMDFGTVSLRQQMQAVSVKMDFGTVSLRQQMQAVSVSVYLKTSEEQG